MITASEIHFTVIVPTHNRLNALRHCLKAIAEQDYPRDLFEVIVVDDGSDSSPEPVVHELRDRLDVTLLTQTNAGPARARNRGAQAARGTFLAFTDDDCLAARSWLKALAGALEAAPHALVGGRIVNALPHNFYSSTSQTIADIVYAHYNSDPNNARFFSSNNLAIAADKYCDIGGFDEGFTILACEDRELCDRWRASRGHMLYKRDAIVAHAHPLTLGSFVRQHFTYGRGAAHFHRIRAERGSGRITSEVSFHLNLDNWLLQPLRRRAPLEAAKIAAFMALWQVTNIGGYLYESVAGTGYRESAREPLR